MNKIFDKIESFLGETIQEYIIIDNLIIVRVDDDKTYKSGDTSLDRNIYAFDEACNFLWQIEVAPDGSSPKPFMKIAEKEGKIVVDNWIGTNYILDVKSGGLSSVSKGDRPW